MITTLTGAGGAAAVSAVLLAAAAADATALVADMARMRGDKAEGSARNEKSRAALNTMRFNAVE